MKNKFIILIITTISLSIPFDVDAQCAMCKAVATSSIDGGQNDVGKGLNNGILYLMTIPYLILGGIFYALYHNRKLKQKNSVSNT
jgi:hypothetical protein